MNPFDFIRRLRGLSNEEKENLSTLVSIGDIIGGKPPKRNRRPKKRMHGGRLPKRRRK